MLVVPTPSVLSRAACASKKGWVSVFSTRRQNKVDKLEIRSASDCDGVCCGSLGTGGNNKPFCTLSCDKDTRSSISTDG